MHTLKSFHKDSYQIKTSHAEKSTEKKGQRNNKDNNNHTRSLHKNKQKATKIWKSFCPFLLYVYNVLLQYIYG